MPSVEEEARGRRKERGRWLEEDDWELRRSWKHEDETRRLRPWGQKRGGQGERRDEQN